MKKKRNMKIKVKTSLCIPIRTHKLRTRRGTSHGEVEEEVVGLDIKDEVMVGMVINGTTDTIDKKEMHQGSCVSDVIRWGTLLKIVQADCLSFKKRKITKVKILEKQKNL